MKKSNPSKMEDIIAGVRWWGEEFHPTRDTLRLKYGLLDWIHFTFETVAAGPSMCLETNTIQFINTMPRKLPHSESDLVALADAFIEVCKKIEGSAEGLPKRIDCEIIDEVIGEIRNILSQTTREISREQLATSINDQFEFLNVSVNARDVMVFKISNGYESSYTDYADSLLMMTVSAEVAIAEHAHKIEADREAERLRDREEFMRSREESEYRRGRGDRDPYERQRGKLYRRGDSYLDMDDLQQEFDIFVNAEVDRRLHVLMQGYRP